MLVINFGEWSNEIHLDPDQMKRIDSASKAAVTPRSVNRIEQTAVFSGSGNTPYETTLNSCTCGDFIRRKKPCKHIYRLAMECGLLGRKYNVGINKNDQITLFDAVGMIENLSDECQQIIKNAIPVVPDSEHETFSVKGETGDALAECPLLVEEKTPMAELVRGMKKVDLISVLSSLGFDYGKKKKDELIAVCTTNDSEELRSLLPQIRTFRFRDDFSRAKRSLRIYIGRKYDWDAYYDENMHRVEFPHGAKFEDVHFSVKIGADGQRESTRTGNPNLCWFPDDEVTQMLTLFGHNRCLNGFDVTKQQRE